MGCRVGPNSVALRVRCLMWAMVCWFMGIPTMDCGNANPQTLWVGSPPKLILNELVVFKSAHVNHANLKISAEHAIHTPLKKWSLEALGLLSKLFVCPSKGARVCAGVGRAGSPNEVELWESHDLGTWGSSNVNHSLLIQQPKKNNTMQQYPILDALQIKWYGYLFYPHSPAKDEKSTKCTNPRFPQGCLGDFCLVSASQKIGNQSLRKGIDVGFFLRGGIYIILFHSFPLFYFSY